MMVELTLLPKEPEHDNHDFSWLVIAMGADGQGYILDEASGFSECEIFPNGSYLEDSGIYVPPEIEKAGYAAVYRIENGRISGGERISTMDGDDWTDLEVSGDWVRMWPT